MCQSKIFTAKVVFIWIKIVRVTYRSKILEKEYFLSKKDKNVQEEDHDGEIFPYIINFET